MSNEQTELDIFLKENNLSIEDYNSIVDKIDFNLLEEYLTYRKSYNIKPEDYLRVRKSYQSITNPPSELTFELFLKHNKDRSYQSNMIIMNDLTKLINSIESTEDLEKTFYESKSSLKEFESTNSLTKFRKVVKTFIDNGKIPKENDSFRQTILTDLLTSYQDKLNDTNQINLLSQDSVTATQNQKDLYCIYRFSDMNEKEVWEKYKWGIPPKSTAIVYSGFMDLVKRFSK